MCEDKIKSYWFVSFAILDAYEKTHFATHIIASKLEFPDFVAFGIYCKNNTKVQHPAQISILSFQEISKECFEYNMQLL